MITTHISLRIKDLRGILTKTRNILYRGTQNSLVITYLDDEQNGVFEFGFDYKAILDFVLFQIVR